MTRIRFLTRGLGIVSPNLVQTHIDDEHVSRARRLLWPLPRPAGEAGWGLAMPLAGSHADHDARRTRHDHGVC
jgi:hypothetical protein